MSADGKQRRRSIPDRERLKLWVRAGGRCHICNRYLLEGQLAYRELTFGEAAHVVGQQHTAHSPRGLAEDLEPDKRDQADNLMLLCDDEHNELDKPGSSDAFGVEFLRELKRRHEDRILYQTSLAPHQRTCPIRMIGKLRGNAVELDRPEVAAAVMHGAGRFPSFELSSRNTIEIDLRALPGETAAGAEYYRIATAKIDETMDHKVTEAIEKEDITHLSVFAFARLPVLIYLGTKLDDVVTTDVYQRHRATESWKWPHPDADLELTTTFTGPGTGEDAVLILNISGSIHVDELPADLQRLPRFALTTVKTPSPDVIAGPHALMAFDTECRKLLAEIERSHKHVRRLHVFPAVPLSAGVVFGRVFDPDVHPTIAIYDRNADGYTTALEVGNR